MKATLDIIVTKLVQNPRPVLFLDTCILLDILRTVERRTPRRADALLQLSTAQAAVPPALSCVTDELVRIEWEQGRAKVKQNAEQDLRSLGDRVTEVSTVINRVLPEQSVPFAALPVQPLADALDHIAAEILNRADEIQTEPACVASAVERVYQKRRPAQDGKLMDAIHLEHCFELSRRLRARQWPHRIIFVSSDTVFGARDRRNDWHSELSSEAAMLQVEYVATLEAAIGNALFGPS